MSLRRENIDKPHYSELAAEKLVRLRDILRKMESVLVAYSGGVDSAFLLKVAHKELGTKAVAFTADSESLARRELAEATAFAKDLGVRHIVHKTKELSRADYAANTEERCYYCRSELALEALNFARKNGYQFVMDGNNTDDLSDFRPGRKAAKEHGIRSPLEEAGLTKAEIRHLAKEMGMSNWDKPASACLASRIPYGTQLTVTALHQVEQAEDLMHSLGMLQVRARHHGEGVRLEVEPSLFPIVLERREEIVSGLKALGFRYVSLDLSGYRMGSMNELLKRGAR